MVPGVSSFLREVNQDEALYDLMAKSSKVGLGEWSFRQLQLLDRIVLTTQSAKSVGVKKTKVDVSPCEEFRPVVVIEERGAELRGSKLSPAPTYGVVHKFKRAGRTMRFFRVRGHLQPKPREYCSSTWRGGSTRGSWGPQCPETRCC